MDWNDKSPLQWDWDHMFLYNAKAAESTKLEPVADWSAEVDREINFGSFYLSGGSGCSGSELIHASSSKSSKSASINSSSIVESKSSKFTLEGSQENSSSKEDMSKEEKIGSPPILETSGGSGESLLSLKLGKRLYFEDLCPGNDIKTPCSTVIPISCLSTAKKCKSNQSLQSQCCQVEGCNLDLSSAKDYYRKHRVCETHSKSSKVVVGGLERRFCQQCSRFHGLSEFDERKRSCRRRLSDHNARRRKPHPEAFPQALPSSLCDGRERMNPLLHSRHTTNLSWQDICSGKLSETKEFLVKSAEGGGTNKSPHVPTNGMVSFPAMPFHNTGKLLMSKGTVEKAINAGSEDSILPSDLNATQDFHHALSLLSTNSRGSHDTKTISPDVANQTSQSVIGRPHMQQAVRQGLHLASSGYWGADQKPKNSHVYVLNNSDETGRFQDFQQFREPYKSSFHSNGLT